MATTTRSTARKLSTKGNKGTRKTATTKAKSSVSVVLEAVREGKSKFVFEGKGLIVKTYISKVAIDVLADNKTVVVDFDAAPADKQPEKSFRFNETGEAGVIGSLYLVKGKQAETLGLTAKSKVRVELALEGDSSVRATVSTR